MTSREPDDQLRRAIAELRRQDERRTPAFGELLARPRRPRRRLVTLPAARLTRLALAATLLIAAVLAYRAAEWRANRLTLPRDVAALSSWRPVTDVLLENSAGDLLRSPSPLSESLINVDPKGALR